jgi:chromosome segregation ATPase
VPTELRSRLNALEGQWSLQSLSDAELAQRVMHLSAGLSNVYGISKDRQEKAIPRDIIQQNAIPTLMRSDQEFAEQHSIQSTEQRIRQLEQSNRELRTSLMERDLELVKARELYGIDKEHSQTQHDEHLITLQAELAELRKMRQLYDAQKMMQTQNDDHVKALEAELAELRKTRHMYDIQKKLQTEHGDQVKALEIELAEKAAQMDQQESANRHLRDVLTSFATSALQAKQVSSQESMRLRTDEEKNRDIDDVKETTRLREEVQQLRKDLQEVSKTVQLLRTENEKLTADRDASVHEASLKYSDATIRSSRRKTFPFFGLAPSDRELLAVDLLESDDMRSDEKRIVDNKFDRDEPIDMRDEI